MGEQIYPFATFLTTLHLLQGYAASMSC